MKVSSPITDSMRCVIPVHVMEPVYQLMEALIAIDGRARELTDEYTQENAARGVITATFVTTLGEELTLTFSVQDFEWRTIN